MFIQLGPHEAALAGKAAALTLCGGHRLRAAAAGNGHRLVDCAHLAHAENRGAYELDPLLDGQPACDDLLHPVDTKTGIEHDLPAADFAGIARLTSARR